MEKLQETFNKDLEELKSKQTMMNNTINEIKNSLEGRELFSLKMGENICKRTNGQRINLENI